MSLLVLPLQFARGDEPPVSAISTHSSPQSAISRSDFALAQRDSARSAPVVHSHPKFQATPPMPGVIVPQATPIPFPSPATIALPSATFPEVGKAASPPLPHQRVTSKIPPLAPIGNTSSIPSLEPHIGPKTLSSRDMIRFRFLDRQLEDQQDHLIRAQGRLTRYQRQLGFFTSALSVAMAKSGDEGAGLNPFVRVAERYRGTPYVWGGESKNGFDCSGFIMRVMRDLGYRALPHSAAEQFNYGMPIARVNLKPGDIVFFANTYKRGVSHVGIYLGQRRFIHAANSRVGTIVSSIDEPKWVEHYAGARRLLLSRT